MDNTKKQDKPNPSKNTNWFSLIFFSWLSPFMLKGYKRKLREGDLYNVLDDESASNLNEKLQREWEKELIKMKQGQKPSLFKAIFRTFGKLYCGLGFIVFLEESVKIVQPILLGYLIKYFSPSKPLELWEAYVFVCAISVGAFVIAIVHHPYFYNIQRIGMRLRIAACALIYRKALRLNNDALGKTTTGQIVNLMTNDVVRFDTGLLFMHYLWVGPLQALVILVFLWHQLGPASLAGFAFLVFIIPIQGWMGKMFSRLRRRTATQTDERVRMMNEILSGMRVIKMYCWEKLFGQIVNKVRKEEMKCIYSASRFRAMSQAPFFFASGKVIGYLTFISLILSDTSLSPSLVFMIIGLFNPIRLTMNLFVPFAISFIAELRITVLRIQKFLLLEELHSTSNMIRSAECPNPKDAKITVMDVSAKWDESSMARTLNAISFEVRAGELLAVVGPVGAGKSSLLMALLGELPLTEGNIKTNGKIAYASQLPWVFSGSVRQNILFGQKFERQKYETCIRIAALKKDFEIMPHGDATLVGERGVSLSGGQKARISLARAVYFDADIYLLDDPLSAVDTAVGKHLFYRCINGALKEKPRILVTHQVQYLKEADRILILKEGSVLGIGTYDDLKREGIDFASLIKKEEEEEDLHKASVYDNIMKLPRAVSKLLTKSTTATDLYDESNEEIDDSKPLMSGLESYEILKNPNQYLSKSADYHKKYLDQEDLTKQKMKMAKSIETMTSGGIGKVNSNELHVSMKSPLSRLSSNPALSEMSIATDLVDGDIAEYIAPIQEEEYTEQGNVSAKYYLKYFQAGGNCFVLCLLVLFNLGAQGAYVACDFWLSYWSTAEEDRQTALNSEKEMLEIYNSSNVTVPEVETYRNLYIYTGITISVFVLGLVRALLCFNVLVKAAETLHKRMFDSIIRSPVLFFDQNPVGRILNRFSKDVGLVDETLPLTMYDFIQCGLIVAGIVIVAGLVNPWVFIPITPLVILFIILRKYYLETSRSLKRLEATCRSPLFSHVSASLQGLYTIRAFQVQPAFIQEYYNHQDQHTEAFFLILASARWFAIRLDLLCATFVTIVCVCSILAAKNLSGGMVGLTLVYAMNLMGLFQWAVRQSTEVENQMTSVERLFEYSELPSEARLDSEPANKPPIAWPQKGEIQAKNVYFSYTKNGPIVLKKLNFVINSTEKIGIVGRTGAGKSTLLAMIFRLVEPTGCLQIDGIDIRNIGLHDLRGKLSIIPQDPTLFTGPVRKNMDPFSQHTDIEIWKALEEVQMKEAIKGLTEGLQAEVTEGGANFSVGQRQLLCLARSVLKKNKILVLDEATANVDPRTDQLIQVTIREKFRDCTVLTIAHRLHTIMDSDRVMVLEQGSMVEFDEPVKLLENTNGYFSKMVNKTGKIESNNLLVMAQEAHKKRRKLYVSDSDTSYL